MHNEVAEERSQRSHQATNSHDREAAQTGLARDELPYVACAIAHGVLAEDREESQALEDLALDGLRR
jgi:hypothetical protein